jgi:hypothetical protein
VLWPNSKTRRSKPVWCATRTASSCAWLLAFPPVVRGQAVAGDDPALAVALGAAVAEELGRPVAVGLGEEGGVVAALTDREADTIAVAVGDEPTSG